MNGCTIMSSFSVVVSFNDTVGVFIEKCKQNPNNNQRYRFEIRSVFPLNLAVFEDPEQYYNSTKYNCEWKPSNITLETKIADSGLCDGAKLAVDSGMCD